MISAYHLFWLLPATAFVFLMIGGMLQSRGKPITCHDDIVGLSPEFRDRQRMLEHFSRLEGRMVGPLPDGEIVPILVEGGTGGPLESGETIELVSPTIGEVLAEVLDRLKVDETYVRAIAGEYEVDFNDADGSVVFQFVEALRALIAFQDGELMDLKQSLDVTEETCDDVVDCDADGETERKDMWDDLAEILAAVFGISEEALKMQIYDFLMRREYCERHGKAAGDVMQTLAWDGRRRRRRGNRRYLQGRPQGRQRSLPGLHGRPQGRRRRLHCHQVAQADCGDAHEAYMFAIAIREDGRPQGRRRCRRITKGRPIMANKNAVLIMACLISCVQVCRADRMALLISAPGGPDGNLSGFADTMQKWYPALLDAGYPAENIFVLDTDGRDNDMPAWGARTELIYGSPLFRWSRELDSYGYYRDRTGNINHTWMDSPKGFYSPDSHVYDGTVESLDLVTTQMSNICGPDDELLVVLVDHGRIASSGDYQMDLWDYWEVNPGDFRSVPDQIEGMELASYIDRIPYARRLIVVATCYAAAAWPAFENDNTAMFANTGDAEVGWMESPIEIRTWPTPYEFVPGNDWGITMAEAISGEGDQDDDGRITWTEVYNYAFTNNPFGVLNPDPTWMGDGYAIEHPELFDPSGLVADWVLRECTVGDANKDGVVDLQDFSILKANFGGSGGWSNGDFNGDGAVDLQDFGLLKANLGAAGQSVPDTPGAMAMIAGLLLIQLAPIRREGQG